MSTFGRAVVRRDGLGMIPSPSRQQASGIYPSGLSYGEARTRSVNNPHDKTGNEAPPAVQQSPSRGHRAGQRLQDGEDSVASPAPSTPVRTVRSTPVRAASSARRASSSGEPSAAVLQVANAAAKLLEAGDGTSPAELRRVLIQQFGARTISKARVQLEQLVPGYAHLERSSPAGAKAPGQRVEQSPGAAVARRRLGSVEPQDGAIDWNSTLRSNVWGDRMERYVGINPKQVTGQDWRSPRRPRSVMPPELSLDAPEDGNVRRTTLAARCSRTSPQPESLVYHPDGHRESTDAEVTAEESRWGCHGADDPKAKMMDVFGASSSVRRGQEPYEDPEFATHRQWPGDLEPERSKDKAKPTGIRARPVEVNRDEARKREVRMQYNNGGVGQRPRPTRGTRASSIKGPERGYSRDEYRYAMRRGAAERLSLVQRLKTMELELTVEKQRNAQQEKQLLRLSAVQNQDQQAVGIEQHSPSSDTTDVVTPILRDPRIRRRAENSHSRASLACEVERELLMLALAAEQQLTVDGGGSPPSAAVRGYAAMVSQLSHEFHAEMAMVLDGPHPPPDTKTAGRTAKDHDTMSEDDVLSMYACVVLDFTNRLKVLRKRHASMRERLTAAAVALHGNARDRDDQQVTTADDKTVGGISLRVSMIRELHELSSIATGDDTNAFTTAVNLTDVPAPSTTSEQDEVDCSNSMLTLPSANQTVAVEYSGREDAVEDGLADLSVSTVGNAVENTLSTSNMAAAAGSNVCAAGGSASAHEDTIDTTDDARRNSPQTWDGIAESNVAKQAAQGTAPESSERVGSSSFFASPSFSMSPVATSGDMTPDHATDADRVPLDDTHSHPEDEVGRLALARLTDKVATLSNINQRLEEQLQQEAGTHPETAIGEHVCICRAAVTELLDFNPQAPRILRNIEVDQVVNVEEVCLTKSGQARGRLQDGGWVSMINRQGVVQFQPTTTTGAVTEVLPPRD